MKDVKTKNPLEQCQWFLMCENRAVTLEPHPILNEVPICNRCQEKLRKIDAATKDR